MQEISRRDDLRGTFRHKTACTSDSRLPQLIVQRRRYHCVAHVQQALVGDLSRGDLDL